MSHLDVNLNSTKKVNSHRVFCLRNLESGVACGGVARSSAGPQGSSKQGPFFLSRAFAPSESQGEPPALFQMCALHCHADPV